MRIAAAAAALVLLPRLAPASTLTVLTVDKVAAFENGRGTVRVGRDPRLAAAPDPTCPSPSSVVLSSHPEPTQRLVVATEVALDCAKWASSRGGFVYRDPQATGGVQSIRYGRKGLFIRFAGPVPGGPVGYLQVWLTVGDTRFNARFHNFKRNDAGGVVTRRPSKAAATGERAFWSLLHQDWSTPAQKAELERVALDCFRRAAKASRKDGRSRFLLAMTHLYRFGQAVGSYDEVSDFARGEIEAAHVAFEDAVAKLWTGTTGDSRVPGFAAAATFGLGLVRKDRALQDQGLRELDAAFELNPFFNLFDYLPVVQTIPAFDPRFQRVFANVSGYLGDPATLQCVTTQPEICGNDGYAPRNTAGSLTLFGDLEAKAGNAAAARQWYGLALSLASAGDRPYRFLGAIEERVATVDQRVALFGDDDPGNDPPVIGARGEACANCHTR